MKSFEIMPTEENLIEALENDILNRNSDLKYFYDLLMAQEIASSISIDGQWGSGKTFFVKQELLLINAKNSNSNISDEKRKRILSNKIFKNGATENCCLGIYYDAWENDNDIDPILSIIYEITKQLSLSYSFEEDDRTLKIAGSILEIISGRNVSGIIETLKSSNPVTKFKEEKELKDKFKDFFSEVLTERGNRLIIFIDELDRCKPSFAVRMLEQIKHYISDNRISFVFSVNLEELQHTIKHYYGDSFNSYRYLDRFFDIRIVLPPADRNNFYNSLDMNDKRYVNIICRNFIAFYNLELREICRYYQHVKTSLYNPLYSEKQMNFSFPEGKGKQLILIYIVPVIIGLKFVNITLYNKFINGKDCSPLINVLGNETFYIFDELLNRDESFEKEEGKKQINKDQIINKLYDAIFNTDFLKDPFDDVNMGAYSFNSQSKQYAIKTANILSSYADYQI